MAEGGKGTKTRQTKEGKKLVRKNPAGPCKVLNGVMKCGGELAGREDISLGGFIKGKSNETLTPCPKK